MAKKILVTGGAGFIGSCFVRMALNQDDIGEIIVLDKLTYAGSWDNLGPARDDPRVNLVQGDIANSALARDCMTDCHWVINFAAESHVDRSLSDASPFMRTNIEGVRVLLELARELGPERFLQIGTDEVYGSISDGETDENHTLRPSSPYSASKAAADMLGQAFFTSFGVPVIIARSANNYGPYQYPEKLIPRFVTLAIQDMELPIYGTGENWRDWLHVEDNCRGLLTLLRKSQPGEVYNIGAHELHQNIEIALMMLDILGKPHSLIKYVTDRAGHDVRYCVNFSKIGKLGWQPQAKFIEQFERTILWYKERAESWLARNREAENFYSKQK